MSSRLTVVDSSAFIEFSRHAASDISEAVDAAIDRGLAAVCDVIAAELLSVCRSRAEYREMELLLGGLEWLPITNECWTRAAALGFNLRRAGVTVPLTDRLHCDAHFGLIGGTPDELS